MGWGSDTPSSNELTTRNNVEKYVAGEIALIRQPKVSWGSYSNVVGFENTVYKSAALTKIYADGILYYPYFHVNDKVDAYCEINGAIVVPHVAKHTASHYIPVKSGDKIRVCSRPEHTYEWRFAPYEYDNSVDKKIKGARLELFTQVVEVIQNQAQTRNEAKSTFTYSIVMHQDEAESDLTTSQFKLDVTVKRNGKYGPQASSTMQLTSKSITSIERLGYNHRKYTLTEVGKADFLAYTYGAPMDDLEFTDVKLSINNDYYDSNFTCNVILPSKPLNWLSASHLLTDATEMS